ncbi:MAG: CoA pyrophosphatase [Pseudomonadota bacterium]
MESAERGRKAIDLSALETLLKHVEAAAPSRDQDVEPAVVFLLLFGETEPHLMAVLKTDTKGYPWRNQVAFPGGHIDQGDSSPEDAAFRELEEELGIRRSQVRLIGSLGHFQTINKREIQVFTGIWDGNGPIRFDPSEISRVFSIPLKELLHIHHDRRYHGRIPSVGELIYPYQDLVIWGLTGRIIHFLLEQFYPHFIKPDPPAGSGLE